MASFDRGNLVVFYSLCTSEICPDKRGCLWWEWPYKMGVYCIWYMYSCFHYCQSMFNRNHKITQKH